jgi:hypothetical protein
MNLRLIRIGTFLLSVALLAAGSERAQAQYYVPYPHFPYYGGFGPGYNAGAMMQGTASVISATGELYQQQEKARILREQANQAKLETRKKNLDTINYERAHTWSFTEEQQRNQELLVRRLLSKPLPAEITSGSAHNTLLPYLNQLTIKGIEGPSVALDPEMLKQINVSAGGSGGPNIGAIKNGKVAWPMALRGPTAKEMDGLILEATSAAINGTLDSAMYLRLTKQTDKLADEASKKWNKEEIDTGSYLDAKHFLESLRSSLSALRSPDAAKYFNNTYAARGDNVGELVRYMTSQGLRFAPASVGAEGAYFGLYDSFVVYASGDRSESGFRYRLASEDYKVKKK